MLKRTQKLAAAASCAAALLFSQATFASDPGCHDAKLFQKLITNFCWDCIYPIKVAGASLGGGSAPSGAYKEPLCICTDNNGVPRPGIGTSMWEPARLVEFQRVPGCSSVLGGFRFPVDRANQGTHGNADFDGGDPLFVHYHYYAFPVLMMLDLFVGTCSNDNFVDLDMMFMSEVDPTWNNDELAFFNNPEAAAVSNPAAIVACSADAVSATAGRPIASMFWCAGAWGTIYPLSGNTSGGDGIIKDSSLLKAKVLATLHRRGMAFKTMGADTICGGKIHPMLPKTMYKFTLFHPIPETKSGHVMGQSTMLWGNSKTIPAVGEDPVYTIWRWNDCCNH